ncbi:MAG: hypothetical protein EOM20_04285 [Spartobacteria bacterium]|nr:hypothetical protein [Spartobacteria bacterium]
MSILRKIIFVSILAALLAPVGAWATGDQLIAQLKPSGYVNDFAHVMPPQQAQALERQLAELEQKTGAEVAVVTVDTLDGGEIDDFANRLFAAWGIGKRGQDNGVLILAAIKDRKGRIEVGYGLEGVIPDGLAGRILRNEMFAEFKTGNYAGGLMQGAQTVARLIADEHDITLNGVPAAGRSYENGKDNKKTGFFDILFIIVVIIIVIRNPWLLLFLGHGGGGGRSGGFGGGGFGGFGGGMSGGGGASGGW